MLSVSNPAQLQQLRTGDRLKYHGVEWQITDYSTYDDPYGYETTEWLLRSKGGNEYYLLREFDPQNPESIVNWYLAEELTNPSIFQPNSQENLVPYIWQDMQEQKEPYPELQLFGKVYRFESQTQGNYEGDEDQSIRTTWDYWDLEHQRNLALEAWSNGQLHVYSTKVVKPQEFSDIQKEGISSEINRRLSSFPIWEFFGALALISIGTLMMIFG